MKLYKTFEWAEERLKFYGHTRHSINGCRYFSRFNTFSVGFIEYFITQLVRKWAEFFSARVLYAVHIIMAFECTPSASFASRDFAWALSGLILHIIKSCVEKSSVKNHGYTALLEMIISITIYWFTIQFWEWVLTKKF